MNNPSSAASQERPRSPSPSKARKEEGKEHDESEAKQEGGEERVEREEEEEEEEAPPRALFKSSRFKGYLTLVVTSGVNYQAAFISDNITTFGGLNMMEATGQQRSYAMAVALISIVFSTFIVLAHIDRLTPMKKYWSRMFKPKSRTEAFIISFLLLWWIIALWVNTGIMGIAGDGKGQYNLYFSSWACFFVCAWTLERWLVSCNYPSLEAFLASWPNRAPGWIAIFFLSLAALLSLVDLFTQWDSVNNKIIALHYGQINMAQWQWLLFVTGFTICPAIGFVLVEIFRETKPGEDKNTKTEWETILEGFILLLLVILWIPSVIVATTPGGAASFVGNAYFAVWGSCAFVVDTSVWWIHDWRKRVLVAIREQEKEYHNIQKKVLDRSRMEIEEEAENVLRNRQEQSDDDDDDMSMHSDSIEGQPIPDMAGT